jgi:endoglucanase
MLFSTNVAAVALFATRAVATIYYAGVAESGGEFGVYSKLQTSCVTSDQSTDNW